MLLWDLGKWGIIHNISCRGKTDMDIKDNWNNIKVHFNNSLKSNFYVSIAYLDSENIPTATPIGSLFLNDDQTGFYFEKFSSMLLLNAEPKKKICVLAFNSNRWFWIKSLLKGKFNNYPAIKLYGELGERREAKESEIRRLKNRTKLIRGLKGYKYLFGDMKFVREVIFTKGRKVNLGEMTKDV